MKTQTDNNLLLVLNFMFFIFLISNMMTPLLTFASPADTIPPETPMPEIRIEDNTDIEAPRLELQTVRTANTKFYSNRDGTTTTEIYIGPVHYKDITGNWCDINTTILPYSEPADDYGFACEKNGLKVYFKDDYSEPSRAVKTAVSDNWLTWEPLSMTITDATGVPNYSFNVNGIESETAGNIIRYLNAFPNTTDEYIVLPNKLKHNLELTAPFQLPSSSLTLNAASATTLDFNGNLEFSDGLRLFSNNQELSEDFTTSAGLELRDTNNEPVLILPPPYAYEKNNPLEKVRCEYFIDSHTSDSSRAPQQCEAVSRMVAFSIKTPYDWLCSATRNYPVVIDPTVSLPSGGSDGIDAYIAEGNASSPDLNISNFGGDSYLRITRNPSPIEHDHRSLLKFDVSGIAPIAEIETASLQLYLLGPNDHQSISAFRVTHSWVEGTGRESQSPPGNDGVCWVSFDGNLTHGWSPGGDKDPKNIYDTIEVGDGGTWYSWDLQELVQGWVDGNYVNHGVMLYGTDGEDVIKEFYSSESSKYPKLVITYNTPPYVNPDYVGYVHRIDEDAPVHYIDLNTLFLDPDTDDTLDFRIWDGTDWNEHYPPTSKIINTSIGNNKSLKLETYPEIYGTETVKLKAIDDSGCEVQFQLKVEIRSVNDAPKILSIDGEQIGTNWVTLSAKEASAKKYVVMVEDKDFKFGGEDLSYEFTTDDGYNMAFGSAMRTAEDVSEHRERINFTFRPTNDDVGYVYINITVTDSAGDNFTAKVRFEIENTNNAPRDVTIKCLKNGKACLDFTTIDTVQLEGNADDIDFYIPDSTESLRYEWSSDIQDDLGNTRILETKLEKGAHEITLKAYDKENEFGHTSIMVNVKNEPSIDYNNCSNDHSDAAGDVFSYSYVNYIANRTTEFEFEKGRYKNIDIISLRTEREDRNLIIYLTVDGVILNTTGYEYIIFLVKSYHMETPHKVEGRYSSRIYDKLYHPDSHEYYAKYTLEDGEISEDDASTIIITTHLGDLEAGENIKDELKSDFDVFAITKYNVIDPSGGMQTHDIAYDSAGHGSVPAPELEKKSVDPDFIAEMGENTIYIIIVIAIVIVIIIVVAILRSRKAEGPKEKPKRRSKDQGIIYDTSQLEIRTQGQPGMVAHPAPPLSMGIIAPPASQLPPIAPPPTSPQMPVQQQPQLPLPQIAPPPHQAQQQPLQMYPPQQVPGQVPGQVQVQPQPQPQPRQQKHAVQEQRY